MPRTDGLFVQLRAVNHRVAVVIILILSAGVRVMAALSRPVTLEGDSVLYDSLARSLVSGHGHAWQGGVPTAIVPPGYPLFLAAVYAAIGPQPRIAYFAQAVVGVLTVLLIMKLAALCLDGPHALTSGVLAALYPGLYWLPGRLLTENLALPLAIAAVCTSGLALRQRSLPWAALTGLFLGCGLLVRGAGLLLAGAVLLGCVLFTMRQGLSLRAVGPTALVGITCVLTIAPWLARNESLLGAPVLSTQAGLTTYSSYWPPQNNGKRIWGNNATAEDPQVREAFGLGSEIATSRHLTAMTRRRLREQPIYFFSLLPEKLVNLLVPLDWEIIPPRMGRTRSLNIAYVLLLFPAGFGAWQLLRRPTHLSWLLWVMPAAVLAQALLFYGSPRFRLMAEPSLLIFAAVGLLSALRPDAGFSRASPRAPDVPLTA